MKTRVQTEANKFRNTMKFQIAYVEILLLEMYDKANKRYDSSDFFITFSFLGEKKQTYFST